MREACNVTRKVVMARESSGRNLLYECVNISYHRNLMAIAST